MKKALFAAGAYTYAGLLSFVLLCSDDFGALCGFVLLFAIVTSAPAALVYGLYRIVKRWRHTGRRRLFCRPRFD